MASQGQDTYKFAGDKSAFGVSEDLAIESTQYLDLGPSLFGIKVDMTEWLTNKNYAYLSLVPPHGNRALSDIFQALTGFTPGINKTDSTEAFLAGHILESAVIVIAVKPVFQRSKRSRSCAPAVRRDRAAMTSWFEVT